MPYFIPLSVVVGVLLSEYIIGYEFLVPWLFAVMTFVGSLNSNFISLETCSDTPAAISTNISDFTYYNACFCLGCRTYFVFWGHLHDHWADFSDGYSDRDYEFCVGFHVPREFGTGAGDHFGLYIAVTDYSSDYDVVIRRGKY